jgi:hypothetical protein
MIGIGIMEFWGNEGLAFWTGAGIFRNWNIPLVSRMRMNQVDDVIVAFQVINLTSFVNLLAALSSRPDRSDLIGLKPSILRFEHPSLSNLDDVPSSVTKREVRDLNLG